MNLHQTPDKLQTRRTVALTRSAAIELFRADGTAGALWVQLRHRGEVFCGLVIEVTGQSDGSQDFVRADTSVGTIWAHARNTRVCGAANDGLCACAGADAGRACAARSGASASPLGNTGVTI